jgi:glucose/arabinose dehydrogenase
VRDHREYLEGEYGRLRTVAQGPDGDLYVLTSNRDGRGDPTSGDDRLLRITVPEEG